MYAIIIKIILHRLEQLNMCKIISSEAVIGNFIIESVERDNYDISIEKMNNYEKQLSENLEKYNYFTRFDFDEILDFTENYPFFVKSLQSNHMKICNKSNNNTNLINKLKRYFRIGMPTLVINEMVSVSKSILASE